MRVTLLYRDGGSAVDGIRDYTRRLAEALAGQGHDISLELLTANRLPPRVEETDVLIVQYNPFSYGRWGVAPWLPLALGRLKQKRREPLLAVMVHEPYMPFTSWRATLMGIWQRGQLAALRATADLTFVSIEAWVDSVRRLGRGPVHHLPVGSMLPDMRSSRARAREDLGIAEETTVLAAFGTKHPSRQLSHLASAAARLHDAGHEIVVLNLGAGAPRLHGVPKPVRIVTPGHLEHRELAHMLSAADLFLAPFIDGVSSRRSTFVAALQHSLPVVGTDGPLTDTFIRDARGACRLVPAGDGDRFADEVVELADSAGDGERARMAVAARHLYEGRFAWSVIAAEAVSYLEEARVNGSR